MSCCNMCYTKYWEDPCSIAFVATPVLVVLGAATFFVISFQAVERYIAVFHPFHYKACFTTSIIIIINVIIWVISSSLILFWTLSRNFTVLSISLVVIAVTFTLVDIFCYLKIYMETKKVEKEIAVQVRIFSQGYTKSESKVARITAMFLISVFLRYLPLTGWCLYGSFVHEKSRQSHYFLYWSVLAALLNSFTNPVISCVQLSVIRNAVFCRTTQQSHLV